MIRRAAIGIALIIIGLLLAPTGMPDDIVTTLPMIALLGSMYVVVAAVGYILIIIGVLLAGHAAIKLLGPAGKVFKHPIILILLVIIAALVAMAVLF